ncbi:hypothetical protein ILUMI_05821 [Ignelater luminosus]|uniref:NFRKB n=1 Tax=Ignelater luminosus TaxID=2038154 RepID=A0A8K0D6G4_IGNLU|nr:hypothetical protein ILUMI_05821 [Ignelater luminosus]
MMRNWKRHKYVVCGCNYPKVYVNGRMSLENSFQPTHGIHYLKCINNISKVFYPPFQKMMSKKKNVTLYKLFNNEVFRFASPLQEFHEHLKAGHYRPDIAKMRLLIKKAERKEAKFRYKLHRERLKVEINESKNKLVNLVRNLPPGVEPRMDRLNPSAPSYTNPISFRTKRRYFQELSAVREKVEETGFSSDENYPEGPPTPLSRKQKRHLNAIKNSASNSERINSTFTTKPNFIDLERLITPNCNPFFISEDSYRNLLLIHKKRRVEEAGEPEYNINGITITDIINRTDLTSFKKLTNPPSSTTSINSLKHHLDYKPTPHKKKIKKEPPPSIPQSPELINKSNPFFGHSSNSELDSDSDSFFDSLNNTVPVKSKTKAKKLHVRPSIHKSIKKEIKTEPLDSYAPSTNSLDNKSCLNDTSSSVPKPLNCVSQFGKITPATLSDLDGIDMMNLPIDLDDSNIDILEFNNKPELMQETHANFLSLVRDIICSTNEHRMSMKILEERLKSWQENPISPLNDWYSLSDNWVSLLPLAINFLSGNCSEQPDDFVPYIEFKAKIDMYQWIGAGRDSDSLLSPLCQYWLEHRNQMKPALTTKEKDDDIEVSDRSQTPPPPRCPTTWSIRKANPEEIKSFQEQERRRYNSPHKAFTYRCNGYESVVGPVKGIYNNQNLGSTKARGHSVLNADRPNFVTILTLVRDATARLPNGEGTRADICELLKSSQYLSINVPDNVLQSVVSGALDRMHTQFDPCVKYEPKRKVWIYLHRNRSEEDFERIHQQYQGISRNLKKSTKNKQLGKPKSKSEKSNKSSTKTSADNTQSQNISEKSKTEQIVQLNITEQQDIRLSNAGSPSTSKQINKSVISTSTSLEQSLLQNRQRKENLGQTSQSPVRHLQKQIPPLSLQEKQINESLLSPSQISSTNSGNKASPPSKNLVKVISSNQGKSLIIPTSNTAQQKLTPNKQVSQQQQQQQPVSQQLLQSIAQQKQLLLQKQSVNTGDQKVNEQKTQQKIPVTLQQQILQSVGPQVQSIKNVTLLRNPTSLQSNPQTQSVSTPVSLTQSSVSQTKELTSVSPATSQPVVQEQVIQSGVQNKVTQQRLTPAQQQQILQTLRQKVLPLQQTVMSSQYRAVSKQKAGSVQMQKQIQPTSLLGQVKVSTTDVASSSKPIITSTQTPLVAKVLTNAAGQVISVESLLAHQKQHGSLPQGTTLRISGTKSGQPNVIQLAASSSQSPVTQFTVATPNIATISSQPKLVISTPVTTAATSTVTVAKTTLKPATKTQTTTKFMPKIAQQLVSAKFVTQNVGGQKIVQPKVIVGQQNPLKIPISSKNIAISKSVGINVAASANTIRMVNAANLNIAQIGGKPVLITSKGNTFQNIQGQNIIIQTQANTSSQGLIIPSTEKTVANTNISQQSSTGNVNIASQQSAQVILSPPLKVQQAPQVVLSSALKPATVSLAQQNQNSTPNQIMLGGQTVRLQTSGAPNTHRVVLASQNQGQIITQQILLPVGFQGTPLNIKALQGLKVVPIAQTQQGRGVQGRQVFARVMNPANIVRMTQTTEAADVGSSSKSTAE